MGRLQRKGEAGPTAQYISRTQAVKRLQVSLKDFRRLCILKGVYPRDPKKKPSKNKSQTWYHKKDILHMQAEPLLNKFRQFKSFLKKYNKALHRREIEKAENLKRHFQPKILLDHLVKERYPDFLDAVADMDDALNMVFLFAQLPSGLIQNHHASRNENCSKLAKEFLNYVVHTKALRKVFASIKGIYVQVEISGQDVNWVIPHKFAQETPSDVDFRIMLTFLDFYETFLTFVNFKLYHDTGLVYPPVFSSDIGLGMTALEEAKEEEQVERFPDQIIHGALFQGMKFFLGREVPQEILEFLILASGGSIVLDSPMLNPQDLEKVTHHVLDRPLAEESRISTREYVQPQWVFDCINVSSVLPVSPYGPGAVLPPHLSPFVDDHKEGYVPRQKQVLEAWKSGQTVVEEADSDEEKKAGPTLNAEQEYENELAHERNEEVVTRPNVPEVRVAGEAEELPKIMMSKKNSRLYSRMQHGIKKKKQAQDKLREKRKATQEH